MLFRLLKLAGTDINAKLAELKADLTRRARTIGLVAGLLLSAAMLTLMVLIVALIALYRWGELHYGVFVGLALVAAVLIIFAIILLGVALTIAKRDGRIAALPAHVTDAPGARVTQGPPRSTADAARSPEGFASYQFSSAKAEDLVEPLFALLAGYLRWPQTGHLAIDGLVRQAGSQAQGTANEAVARAAELMRKGDRTTMLSVLGAAALFGWLIGHAAARNKVNKDRLRWSELSQVA
jgi:hypothetical protein